MDVTRADTSTGPAEKSAARQSAEAIFRELQDPLPELMPGDPPPGDLSEAHTGFPDSTTRHDSDSAVIDADRHYREALDRFEKQLAATRIPPPPLMPMFALGISALLVTIVGLSLFLSALLAFLVWLVCWHAFQTIATLSDGPFFIFHLPVGLLGGTMLFLMLRPLFKREKRVESAVVLRAADQPRLFDLVGLLCKATGASFPKWIEVDCEPNASARRSAIWKRKSGYALRLGLPLAYTMTVDQFAGVIAHELGHFNQQYAMHRAQIIRQISGRLGRIVEHFDVTRAAQRERMAQMASGNRLFAQLLMLPGEAARGLVFGALFVGEFLTRGVSRQMEFQADCVEASVCGSAIFEKTGHLLVRLQIAANAARRDVGNVWDSGTVPDNFPLLIKGRSDQIARHDDEIAKSADSEKTRWFDTHPSHLDRVANVRRSGASAAVNCSLPATTLFSGLDDLSHRATIKLYDSVEPGRAKTFVPAREWLAGEQKREHADNAMSRFLLGMSLFEPLASVVIPPAGATVGVDVAMLKAQIVSDRIEMSSLGEKMANAAVQSDMARIEMIDLEARISVIRSIGVPGLISIQRKLDCELAAAQGKMAATKEITAKFDAVAKSRLTAALTLLMTDADTEASVRSAHAGTDPRLEVNEVLTFVNRFKPHFTAAESLSALTEKLISLDSILPKNSADDLQSARTRALMQSTAQSMLKLLREMHFGELSELCLPAFFEATTTLGKIAVRDLPMDANNWSHVHAASLHATTVLFRAGNHAISRLTHLAELVEARFDLQPLPAAPTPEDFKRHQEASEKLRKKRDEREARGYWTGYGIRAAFGSAVLAALVWVSMFPPALPFAPWAAAGQGMAQIRPRSFQAPIRTYTQSNSPPVPRQQPGVWTPGEPAYSSSPFAPRQPGYPNDNPNQQPRRPGQPYIPGGSDNSSRPGSPGYSPNRPAGPGNSPGYNPGRGPQSPSPRAPSVPSPGGGFSGRPGGR